MEYGLRGRSSKIASGLKRGTVTSYSMDSCKTENLQVELEPRLLYLVAEWTHFTFFGIILPTIITHYKTKIKVYTFWGIALKPCISALYFKGLWFGLLTLGSGSKPSTQSAGFRA